jgi:tRNA uracil 4-sulfurtransferase
MKPVIVVHHHEIVLKRNNRGYFERQLFKNIHTALSGLSTQTSVRGGYGRFVIELDSEDGLPTIIERLTKVFGLANICAGVKVEQNLEVFCATAEQLLEGSTFKSIKVHTTRPDKNFPIRSMDVNAKVGEYLCNRFNVHANLTKPDETIYIEIVETVAYVYRSKLKGAGGLPVGVSGNVVALLSAGFDSPVAAWQMMKRGASVIFVHFHSMPYTTQRSVEQVRQLVEILTTYQFKSKLYLVPFADLQNEIVLHAPQSLRVILYRRMMIRIAEAIALHDKAEALVTGEAVGQVASQTLRNIRVINDVAGLPILRPLSGMDKEETIALARKIGTHDISKEPYDDCCSFLAPRKPETWANPQQVIEAETKLDINRLVEITMSKITSELFSYPFIEKSVGVNADPK